MAFANVLTIRNRGAKIFLEYCPNYNNRKTLNACLKIPRKSLLNDAVWIHWCLNARFVSKIDHKDVIFRIVVKCRVLLR